MTPAVDKQRIARELDARYAGVGWWGLLYRAPERRLWYRLIPVAEVGAEQRAELAAWRERPRRADLVPVTSDPRWSGDQWELAGNWFQVVCYETGAGRSLAEAIERDGAAERVSAVAEVLRGFEDWSGAIGPGLVAMPAEIVLAPHRPLLLPLPGWGPPSLAQVFAEPERAAYLTPEAARGVADERVPGMHALAVAARSCFETLPEGETARLLHRAAAGVAFADQRRDGRLPSWMREVKQVAEARERLRVLTGPRPPQAPGGAEPGLDAALDAAWRAMDPVAAVRALRAAGDPRGAVGLAHAALVDRPGYRLPLLAAEIARRDLREPFEALSLLDRAVEIDPDRADAYAEQLSIISGLWSTASGRLVAAFDRSFAARLEATARKAFDALPGDRRRDHAHEMARCLIGQGRVAEANVFVHRWLFQDGTLMWWQFALMLDYADTFLLLSRLDDAGQAAGQVRAGLRRVREKGEMSPSEIHVHGMRLADFDHRLLAARKRKEGA
jgi:hypothetical protein